MNARLLAKYPPEILSEMFKSQEELASFFEIASYQHAEYFSRTSGQYAQDGVAQTAFSKNLKAIKHLKHNLPIYKTLYDSLSDIDGTKQAIKRKINNMERALEERQDKQKRFTAQGMLKDSIEDHGNHLKAKAIDILIDHIGNWFEEGHLGAGTVEFRGRKFTAK